MDSLETIILHCKDGCVNIKKEYAIKSNLIKELIDLCDNTMDKLN